MKKRGKKSIDWTSKDVLSLVTQEVENSPNNLARAFDKVADALNTTHSNVSNAWYRTLKFNIKGFTVKSNSVKTVNSKNDRRLPSSTPIHQSIVSTHKFDGMRVVTIKQYFVA